MSNKCEVIRDLLPLYADDVCSESSRLLIEHHLKECPDCAAELEKIRSDEIEENLREEKDRVIEYQAKRFRRRSTTVGSVVSGLFMVPILVCLIVNLSTGHALDWFYVVLAGLAVCASLVLVPLTVPRDKLFWTFCAFTLSVLLLMAVCNYYTHGNWFFLAASAVLFGFSLIFLPFLIKARPVRELIGNFSRPLLVLSVDMILFANMMNMIFLHSKSILTTVFMFLLCAAGAWLLVSAIKDKRGE
ncbi:MAG: zf-HC2 domain-containing protein [Clostridia bacterium]|nr:zf-HC2 domain-containing protein [Clostridia bacterium]